MLRGALLLAITGLLVTGALAQTPDPATNAIIDGVYRETEHNKPAVLQKIRSTLSDPERAIFDSLTFKVDRNSWNIFEVYAIDRLVNVSIGFIIHLNMINGALAYEIYQSGIQNTTADASRPLDFANYYVDTLVANAQAPRLGRPTSPLKSYFQWLGMKPDEISALFVRLNADPAYLRTTAMVNEGSLLLVFGHEVGHHVLGHLRMTSRGPKEETAADGFAMKRMVQAGYPPLLAIGTFVMFDRFERQDGGAPISGDHPPALCRWYRALAVGWSAIKDDPQLIEEYRKRGRAEEIDRMDDLMQIGARHSAEKCPTSSLDLCDTITRYLVKPPAVFIAERGEGVDPGRWQAKSNLPNADCYVREKHARSRTTHRLSCVVNSRNSEAVVTRYYADAASEIEACIGKMRNALQWQRESSDDVDDGDRTIGRTWSLSDGAASFEIQVDETLNAAKSRYSNSFSIDYMVQ